MEVIDPTTLLPAERVHGKGQLVCPECGGVVALVSTEAQRSNGFALVCVGVVCPADGYTYEYTLRTEGIGVSIEVERT